MKSRTPRLLFGSAMIMALLLMALLPTPSPSLAPAGSRTPSTLDAHRARPGSRPGAQRRGAGDRGRGPEGENLLSMEEYFFHRVAYPTGRFDPAWYVAGKEQDRRVERALPEGELRGSRSFGFAPLSLDPMRFTSLGPKPLQSDGCFNCYSYGQVAGRINAMAIDPVTPNVAYLGSDGGGVWKTTDCCSAGDDLVAGHRRSPVDHDRDRRSHHRPEQPQHRVRRDRRPEIRFVLVRLRRSSPEYRSGRHLDSPRRRRLRPGVHQPPGNFPQYQAIGKVRVDPNDSNRSSSAPKPGCSSRRTPGPLDGSVPDQQLHHPAAGHHRSDPARHRDRYPDLRLHGRPWVRNHHAAQPRPERRERRVSRFDAFSGCPVGWETLSRPDNGWPADTAAASRSTRDPRREPTRPPRCRDLAERPRRDLRSRPGDPRYGRSSARRATRRLADHGRWNDLDPRSTQAGLTGCYRDYPQNWYDQYIVVDPNNSDIVFIGTVDIFRSTNGGTTFTNLTCGYAGGTTVHVDQHALAFVPGSSSVLLAGNDGGAYVSTNADAANPVFTQLNDTLSTLEMYSGDITANFATAAQPGSTPECRTTDRASSSGPPAPRRKPSGNSARAATVCSPASSRCSASAGIRRARTAT